MHKWLSQAAPKLHFLSASQDSDVKHHVFSISNLGLVFFSCGYDDYQSCLQLRRLRVAWKLELRPREVEVGAWGIGSRQWSSEVGGLGFENLRLGS